MISLTKLNHEIEMAITMDKLAALEMKPNRIKALKQLIRVCAVARLFITRYAEHESQTMQSMKAFC